MRIFRATKDVRAEKIPQTAQLNYKKQTRKKKKHDVCVDNIIIF